MCDLICDVIICCAWSCDTGEINAFDKIMFEDQKEKIKYGNKINFYINLHVEDRFGMDFTAC